MGNLPALQQNLRFLKRGGSCGSQAQAGLRQIVRPRASWRPVPSSASTRSFGTESYVCKSPRESRREMRGEGDGAGGAPGCRGVWERPLTSPAGSAPQRQAHRAAHIGHKGQTPLPRRLLPLLQGRGEHGLSLNAAARGCALTAPLVLPEGTATPQPLRGCPRGHVAC